MKKYNREAISVWASVDSTIMENCRKTVRMHLCSLFCFKDLSPTYFPLSYRFSFPFLSMAELLHALHVHCKARFKAAPALLHRSLAICSPRREFPAVLLATNHEQVSIPQIFHSVLCNHTDAFSLISFLQRIHT